MALLRHQIEVGVQTGEKKTYARTSGVLPTIVTDYSNRDPNDDLEDIARVPYYISMLSVASVLVHKSQDILSHGILSRHYLSSHLLKVKRK